MAASLFRQVLSRLKFLQEKEDQNTSQQKPAKSGVSLFPSRRITRKKGEGNPHSSPASYIRKITVEKTLSTLEAKGREAHMRQVTWRGGCGRTKERLESKGLGKKLRRRLFYLGVYLARVGDGQV